MAVKINREKCIGCAGCVSVCPKIALDYVGSGIEIEKDKCNECGICVKFCPVSALYLKK